MPAQLISLSDEPSILIDKPILLIGRHPECDIQIESRKISRRHCCIAQVADYLVVRDLASTNGIRINGVRVLEGRLKENDELMIGGLRYRVSWELPPAASPGPAPGRRAQPEPRQSAQPIAAHEDDLLEASDEPVALVDHCRAPPASGSAKASAAAGEAAPPGDKRAAESRPAPRPEQSSSPSLP